MTLVSSLFPLLTDELQYQLLSKVAADKDEEKHQLEPSFGSRVLTSLKGVGAIGAGTALGAAGAYGANALYKHIYKRDIPLKYLIPILPVATTASGILYNEFKRREHAELDGKSHSHSGGATHG
jgi:hypothetical protein